MRPAKRSRHGLSCSCTYSAYGKRVDIATGWMTGSSCVLKSAVPNSTSMCPAVASAASCWQRLLPVKKVVTPRAPKSLSVARGGSKGYEAALPHLESCCLPCRMLVPVRGRLRSLKERSVSLRFGALLPRDPEVVSTISLNLACHNAA